MSKPEIQQLKRKELEKRLVAAEHLIFDLFQHLQNAIPFYGYMATVEDLKEENYALQRRVVAFRVQPDPAQLIKWLDATFDQLRMKAGIKPGDERQWDEIGEFLGHMDWVRVRGDRIGE